MKLNVQIDGQNFEVEVGNLNEQPIRVVVDGEPFEVSVEEDRPSDAVAAPVSAAKQPCQPATPVVSSSISRTAAISSKSVTAPIPGVILSIGVKPGEAVKIGQELCVLEAMKMKNIIRAARDGRIAVIHIAAGEHVSHGQALMDYSE